MSKVHIKRAEPARVCGKNEGTTDMKRWDGLVDGYLESCEQRGLSEETRQSIRYELEQWGCWLRRRQPRVDLEQVGHDLHIQYIWSRTRFRSKATVVSVARIVSRLAAVSTPGSGNVFVPAGMSLNRARAGHVMLEPSGFPAMGTLIVSAPGRGVTSPCQPLCNSR